VSPVQLLVTLLGIAGIALVNRYFLFSRSTGTAAAESRDGLQRITVEVDGGYTPSVFRVRAGQPVRVDFKRNDSGSCTEEVVFGDFGIRTFLATGTTTPVQFTPRQAGTYEFACGMGMVRGKMIVE
jgi:plastocyanin domain-containing protein